MSKPQKWRAGLPEIDWKDPEYIIKVHQVLNGQPVSYLNESQIDLPQTGNKTVIAKWAAHIFQQQGGYAIHPVIGAVGFDKRSAERSLGHGGFSKYKNMAFLAVKDVLEKGIIVAVDDARDNERSYFVSAPISINQVESVATVLVHKDMNIQKMYLHSVIEKENLLMPLQCRTDQMQKAPRHPTSLTSADIQNVLHIALTVNTEKHLQQTPNAHTPTKQTESLINLRDLCPREAGKKLFQVTQGALSQWDLMQRSAAAAGFKLDKAAILAVQGQHPLIIEDTLMKAVKVNVRHTQNEKTQNHSTDKSKER
uniref:VirB12 n=1 Tax=Dichelobacter nodosus TaxID=870 RepID=Q5I735_DICNO|nr:VirB12 [Dichelobacter nodosus]